MPPLPPPPARAELQQLADETERQDDSVGRLGTSRAPHALLRVFRGTPGGTAFRVPARGTTVGRTYAPPAADLLLDDGRMSKRHAQFRFDGGGWSVTDLGSRNGAFVDGAVLAPGQTARLDNGSVVRLGDTLTVFVTDDLDQDDGPDPACFPGVSAHARRVRRRIDVLTRATGHVLVLGETGSGKERVARRIGSRTAAHVPVNCAELSPELARSELFGHEKGAFSGAIARDGLVDAARDGVLFLDEIGELPLDVQSELLRFLEDGSYRRVGSSELRTSNARVVAATNVDLEEAARTGSFRRDLLARLKASNPPLSLPSLRERSEDIPFWIDHFIHEAVADVPVSYLDPGALECLLLYPWPENLRELRGAIRGAVEDPQVWPLSSARLPAAVLEHRTLLRGLDAATKPPRALGTGATRPLPRPPLAAAEPAEPPSRAQIETALTQTRGVMKTAAELLRIDRRSLYRLCEKLGIDPDTFRQGD